MKGQREETRHMNTEGMQAAPLEEGQHDRGVASLSRCPAPTQYKQPPVTNTGETHGIPDHEEPPEAAKGQPRKRERGRRGNLPPLKMAPVTTLTPAEGNPQAAAPYCYVRSYPDAPCYSDTANITVSVCSTKRIQSTIIKTHRRLTHKEQ